MSRQRLRTVPLQIRLTEDEHERMRAIAQQERSTASDVVRAWIGQYQLHAPIDTLTDPRQLGFFKSN